MERDREKTRVPVDQATMNNEYTSVLLCMCAQNYFSPNRHLTADQQKKKPNRNNFNMKFVICNYSGGDSGGGGSRCNALVVFFWAMRMEYRGNCDPTVLLRFSVKQRPKYVGGGGRSRVNIYLLCNMKCIYMEMYAEKCYFMKWADKNKIMYSAHFASPQWILLSCSANPKL